MKFLNFRFSFFVVIIAFIGIILIPSCKKNNDNSCSIDFYNTYEGTNSCSGQNFDLTMTLHSSFQPDENLIMVSTITGQSIEGILSEDNCTIDIPSQEQSGQEDILSGEFNLDGDILTGTINYSGFSCSYNLSKN